jgi:hypothetical protein
MINYRQHLVNVEALKPLPATVGLKRCSGSGAAGSTTGCLK